MMSTFSELQKWTVNEIFYFKIVLYFSIILLIWFTSLKTVILKNFIISINAEF